MYENEYADSTVSFFKDKSWQIIKKDKSNVVNTLNPYQKKKRGEENNWSIIEVKENKNADFPTSELPGYILYESPFFLSKKGAEAGLSHLFYVRLYKEEDVSLLKVFAGESNVEILGNNKFMPLWYTLACTKKSAGNALEMANLFYESGEFSAAEPNLMVNYSPTCVNDEYFSDQWNLNNTGQYDGTSGVDIQICDAWEITSGSSDIVVAVVDHGIELDHPDLLNMFSLSYDTESGTQPSNVYGAHAIACSGIIGASADNSDGIAGIAPNCPLMSISNRLVLAPNVEQNLANGINWAWHNDADIISNSWGDNSLESSFIDNAIDSALTFGRNGLGCVVVFATGNDNDDVQYPANSNSDIIAVGAISPCGERKSPSSCDGEDWGSNYGAELDLVAPGVLIPTTDRQGNSGYNPDIAIHVLNGGTKISSDYDDDDYTVWFNGTSAAAPHVSGVAALILSVNPDLTQDEVRDIIESTCTKVGGYSYSTTTGRSNGTWDDEVGYGCVNAHAAVRAAMMQGVTISGSKRVCDEATYTIQNFDRLPEGVTVQWSVNNNILTLVSGQGTEACVFRKNETGISLVQAEILLNSQVIPF